jgi:TolB-like protein
VGRHEIKSLRLLLARWTILDVSRKLFGAVPEIGLRSCRGLGFSMIAEEVCFGPFCLHVRQRKLTKAGATVSITRRPLDILLALASAKGGIVSKDELMAQVWMGQIVEENALQVQISALRKVLAEKSSDVHHVVTVPGRGYRLTGLNDAESVRQGRDPEPSVLTDSRSIVVLPFQNISSDPEQEYFADGIVEDIIAGLSRIKWLLVIARNSSFVYKGRPIDVKQVARDLGVRYVLEGSVRKAADRVRINVQLIEAETGVHLWVERYERQLQDIFVLQDEITMCVLGAIEPSLRKAEMERVKRKRPDSLDAYDLVLRAMPFANTHIAEDTPMAIPLLQKALELDPNYAAAHGLLAWCYHFRFSRGGLREPDRQAAVHHARAAITHGSDDPTALGLAGFVMSLDHHDHATAMDLFDRALMLSNCNIYALGCSSLVLSWLGRPELAIDRANRALRLSPYDSLNYLSYNALAISYFCTGRHEESYEAAQKSVHLNSRFSVSRAFLTAALVGLKRLDDAKSEAERVLALDPTFSVRRFGVTVGIEPRVYQPLSDAWQAAGLPE